MIRLYEITDLVESVGITSSDFLLSLENKHQEDMSFLLPSF